MLTSIARQTEMVRPSLDLVGLMIKLGLASNDPSAFELPEQSEVAAAHGHAIEARASVSTRLCEGSR